MSSCLHLLGGGEASGFDSQALGGGGGRPSTSLHDSFVCCEKTPRHGHSARSAVCAPYPALTRHSRLRPVFPGLGATVLYCIVLYCLLPCLALSGIRVAYVPVLSAVKTTDIKSRSLTAVSPLQKIAFDSGAQFKFSISANPEQGSFECLQQHGRWVPAPLRGSLRFSAVLRGSLRFSESVRVDRRVRHRPAQSRSERGGGAAATSGFAKLVFAVSAVVVTSATASPPLATVYVRVTQSERIRHFGNMRYKTRIRHLGNMRSGLGGHVGAPDHGGGGDDGGGDGAGDTRRAVDCDAPRAKNRWPGVSLRAPVSRGGVVTRWFRGHRRVGKATSQPGCVTFGGVFVTGDGIGCAGGVNEKMKGFCAKMPKSKQGEVVLFDSVGL